MLFKSLIVFPFLKDFSTDYHKFKADAEKMQFAPCGTYQAESKGWIAPFPGSELVININGKHTIATLCVEKKKVAGATLRQILEKRTQEQEQQTGQPLSRKETKALKESITQELLAKAVPTQERILVWINLAEKWIGIAAGSTSKAEAVLKFIADTVKEFPVKNLTTQNTPMGAMSEWLSTQEAPQGFTLDQECELKAMDESKATVKYVRHSLDLPEIQGHISEGKLPVSLSMTHNSETAFTLTSSGAIKKIKILDMSEVNPDKEDDALAVFKANLTLETGLLSDLHTHLIEALGGIATE